MIREKYDELIDYVTYRTGSSRNRVWQVLKEYSEVLKLAVRRGDDVKVEGLVCITFTTSYGYMYENRVYGLDEQVEDISEVLGLDNFDVRNIVRTYLKRIHDRLMDGYQVNLKGVCYLIPTDVEGDVFCVTRVSPVLKKPEVADFILTTENGLVLKELTEDDLRFRIEVEEDIEYLHLVADGKEKELTLREINI